MRRGCGRQKLKGQKMNKLNEGDWVLVKNTGDCGVLERFLSDGKAFVRIPSKTDWPFPKWEIVSPQELKRTRSPSKPKPQLTTEEALL